MAIMLTDTYADDNVYILEFVIPIDTKGSTKQQHLFNIFVYLFWINL